MIVFFSILLALIIFVLLYLRLPLFGATATGRRREAILKSPNFKNGSFANRSETPPLTEGFTMGKITMDFIFKKRPRARPGHAIPSIRTDLKKLPAGDWFVWLGHSSYLMRLDGLTLLIDPVLSRYASPIPGANRPFKGTDIYTPDDLPPIDYLFITHDHYDHLDYSTICKLNPKVKNVICGLGVGAHLERWGYNSDIITEMDWDTSTHIQNNITVHGLTARHFSGRSFKRDQTLWMSFLLQTPTRKIYLGGDSGYDVHFSEIGKLHGPIDLAILENGQYNEAWKAIHFLPGENLQAAKDLQAKRVIPVHSMKYAQAMHDWDEPLKEMIRLNQSYNIPLLTPMIGEPVDLNNYSQVFPEWWTEADMQPAIMHPRN